MHVYLSLRSSSIYISLTNVMGVLRPVLKKLELRRSSKFERSLGRSVVKNYFYIFRKRASLART
jgi:hypothetical protein